MRKEITIIPPQKKIMKIKKLKKSLNLQKHQDI